MTNSRFTPNTKTTLHGCSISFLFTEKTLDLSSLVNVSWLKKKPHTFLCSHMHWCTHYFVSSFCHFTSLIQASQILMNCLLSKSFVEKTQPCLSSCITSQVKVPLFSLSVSCLILWSFPLLHSEEPLSQGRQNLYNTFYLQNFNFYS